MEQAETGTLPGLKDAKPAAAVESPHRGLVLPEAICDGIVFVLALPAGIYFFWLGGRRPQKDERRAA